MPNVTTDKLRELEARCRLAAADLETEGFVKEHDSMILIANSLTTGAVRTAQGNLADAFGTPATYQTQELADVGSPENPRPTLEDIESRPPAEGGILDKNRRGPEDVLRKWVVEIRDVPAENEEDLRSKVEPFVQELGALLSDYKEEAPRTRQRTGGGGGG